MSFSSPLLRCCSSLAFMATMKALISQSLKWTSPPSQKCKPGFKNRLGSPVEVSWREPHGAETKSTGILKANALPLEANDKPCFTLVATKTEGLLLASALARLSDCTTPNTIFYRLNQGQAYKSICLSNKGSSVVSKIDPILAEFKMFPLPFIYLLLKLTSRACVPRHTR